jgi:hypothetical protein
MNLSLNNNNSSAVGINLSLNQGTMECFDKTMNINPDYIDAKISKGYALFHLGRSDEATQLHDKILGNSNRVETTNEKAIPEKHEMDNVEDKNGSSCTTTPRTNQDTRKIKNYTSEGRLIYG